MTFCWWPCIYLATFGFSGSGLSLFDTSLMFRCHKEIFSHGSLKHKAPCTTVRGISKVELKIIVLYETQVRTHIPFVMCNVARVHVTVFVF